MIEVWTTEARAVVAVLGAAWLDFLRRWRELLLFEAGFKLVQAWLLVPAVAVALAVVMSRAGYVAVNDWDLLDFLLTPVGLVYASLLGVFTATLLLLESAAVLGLVGREDAGGARWSRSTPRAVGEVVWKVTQLGAMKFGLLVLVFVPLALLLGLTYLALLSQQDIYYYLATKPAGFWLAAGIAAVLILVGGVVAVLLGVRWALALPILLYERSSARESLQASGVAVAGMRLRVGMLLLGWPLVSTLLGVVGGIVFRTLLTALPEEITRSPLVLALLLVLQGLLIAALSFTTTVGQALSMRRLYLQQREQSHAVVAGGDAREAAAEEPHEETHDESQAAGSIWVGWCAGLVLIGFPLVLWVGLTESLVDPQRVQVTAHRGYDRVAPENTRSAIQAAIEIGADYAEIDVQLTADGAAVLLHDRDLKRVTGDPRPIREVSFAELQTLDAGSWFSREFANERVPTLAEILDLARGRIKLNIELKVDSGDLGVAREVARLISEGKCEGDCIVTSFSQAALREIRRANPNIRTGLIVATALGDVTRFEGELLSLRADRLTDTVLRQAHRQGLELHLWGISRERDMVRQILRGVDNLITGDPDLLIRVRSQLAEMSDAERLVLGSRVLLGLKE